MMDGRSTDRPVRPVRATIYTYSERKRGGVRGDLRFICIHICIRSTNAIKSSMSNQLNTTTARIALLDAMMAKAAIARQQRHTHTPRFYFVINRDEMRVVWFLARTYIKWARHCSGLTKNRDRWIYTLNIAVLMWFIYYIIWRNIVYVNHHYTSIFHGNLEKLGKCCCL